RIAESTGGREVRVKDRTVPVDEDHDVRAALDQRAQPLLAAAQRALHLLALGDLALELLLGLHQLGHAVHRFRLQALAAGDVFAGGDDADRVPARVGDDVREELDGDLAPVLAHVDAFSLPAPHAAQDLARPRAPELGQAEDRGRVLADELVELVAVHAGL